MKHEELDLGLMRLFVWSGILVIVTLIVAQGWMMGFVPSPPPSSTPQALAQNFIDRRLMILSGALVQCIGWTFWITWTIAITMFIRRMERGAPILTYTSLVINGGGYVFFLLIPMTWAVICFRAETLDPSIIQVMNDWVWFDWLYTWPPFSLWMIVIAIAVLRDQNAERIFPRWVGYFNAWSALLIIPAGMIGFFKTGPFAYNGAISFWFAVLVFFGWILTMSIVAFRAIAAEERRLRGASARTGQPADAAPLTA